MSVMDKFKLDNKTAIITGGAGLLGPKHAETILEAGGNVVLVDICPDKLEKQKNLFKDRFEDNLKFFQADITNKKSVKSILSNALSYFGQVDILINNAARDPKVSGNSVGSEISRFENLPLEVWEEDLRIGLTGAFLCSQVFGQHMAENKTGVILNISSDLGLIAPDQRIYKKENTPDNRQPVKPASYPVMKGALISLTKYLATYWAKQGIRVNAICPGGVYTGQSETFVRKLTDLIPMGRMAEVDEYKAAVLFMVCDASSYMTGSVVSIDGGRTTW